MTERTQWTVFETEWGCCLLACRGVNVVRFGLPQDSQEDLVRQAQEELGLRQGDTLWRLASSLQVRIRAYFKGSRVDFADVPIDLDGMSPFATRVLQACRRIEYGRTVTYAELARMAGNPDAVRAVGTALSNNPIPLIIPCHRVIRSDGRVGGFTAAQGPILKERMLGMEAAAVADRTCPAAPTESRSAQS